VLGGLAISIYGALLTFAPLVGALVLTWWLGAYAIVFGLALMAVAIKNCTSDCVNQPHGWKLRPRVIVRDNSLLICRLWVIRV